MAAPSGCSKVRWNSRQLLGFPRRQTHHETLLSVDTPCWGRLGDDPREPSTWPGQNCFFGSSFCFKFWFISRFPKRIKDSISFFLNFFFVPPTIFYTTVQADLRRRADSTSGPAAAKLLDQRCYCDTIALFWLGFHNSSSDNFYLLAAISQKCWWHQELRIF
jgi:hypothetical protein